MVVPRVCWLSIMQPLYGFCSGDLGFLCGGIHQLACLDLYASVVGRFGGPSRTVRNIKSRASFFSSAFSLYFGHILRQCEFRVSLCVFV